MHPILRKSFVILLSVIASFGLLISIPLLHQFLRSGGTEKKYTKTQVSLTKQIQPDLKPLAPRPSKAPKRATTMDRTVKAGPRFTMDLGPVGGSNSEGAIISSDLIRAPGGGGGGGVIANGDVDEKPSLRGAPAFQAPQSIRESETDALLRLSFCVDASGRVYDIRVVEESPAGKGLAQAGRDALSRTSFQPARKDGNAVPFCGLEQPFEIKFRD
jgi:protein TonB